MGHPPCHYRFIENRLQGHRQSTLHVQPKRWSMNGADVYVPLLCNQAANMFISHVVAQTT